MKSALFNGNGIKFKCKGGEMAAKFGCLNPTGIAKPVDTFPLAPRLDTIEGKNVCLSICGEPDITIALEKKLKSDYTNVNWTINRVLL